MKRCEICGVKSGRQGNNKRKFLSKFPLNEARCRQWVKVTGNEDLIHIPIEKLHELKYVCDNHFKIEDFNQNRTKLKRDAVPTQNLWCDPMPDEMLKDFPLHVAGDSIKRKNIKKTHVSYLEAVPVASLKDHDYNPPPPELNLKPSTSTSAPHSSDSAPIVNKDASPSEKVCKSKGKINSRTTPNNLCYKNISDLILIRPSTSASTTNPVISQVSENVLDDIPTPSEPNTTIDDISAPKPAKIMKLQEKLATIKNEYKILKKKDDLINNISSPVLKSIVESAITNSNRKYKCRHFDEFNKTLAIAIYKNSPKTYKYLSQLFQFPSIRTLLRANAPISIDTCIDKNMINNLQERTKNLTDDEKICVLIFNTMDLKKRLMYNVNTDKIDGYEDFGGDQRTGNIASSVLVTMVQGIRKNFKQPIAHYFFNGNMPTERLANVIESNIKAITESGYEVIATVCDHRPTNMAALNLLKTWGNSPDSHYFIIDDKKIFIIYDVPHLLKSIRDNFYEAGDMVIANKRGKWEHLLLVEKMNSNMLYFQKITKLHVKPNIKPNMKVNCAIEILSNTVAAILKCLSTSVDYRENGLDILQTAHVIEFLDRLFDCTNGPSSKSDVKKNIRENVTKNSFHHTLWNDYKMKLGSTKFINSNDQYTFKNASCIKGYITTLSSLQEIWSYLESKNIKSLNLRRLNMDALEDLFTKIRQYCPPFNNPTCYQFISGLKSSIISHLSAPLAQITCEEEGYRTLCEFQKIVFPKQDSITKGKNVSEEMSEIQKLFKHVDIAPTIYIGGYLASVLLRYESCRECIKSIKVTSPVLNTMYDCNALREWWKNENSLTYPSEGLCRAVDAATEAFESSVQSQIYVKNVVGFCKNEIAKRTIDFSWLCELHKDKISEQLIRLLSVLFIRNYCQIANKFLIASTGLLKKPVAKKRKAIETEYVAEVNNTQQPFSEFSVYLAPDGHRNS